jgi:hypothetical protein
MAKNAEATATKTAAKPKKTIKPKKVEIQTKENEGSVDAFLISVADEQKRTDALEVLEMMQKATKSEPKMWGASLIGFGSRVYESPATGRQVDWFHVGFSPRKANLSLYVLNGFEKQDELLGKLGKHTTGQGCLYIKKLDDVDRKVLKQIVDASVKKIKSA